MQKSITILYTGDGWELEQPPYTPSQKFAYDLWGNLCAEKNILLTRAAASFFNGQTFDKYWLFQDGKWLKKEEAFLPTVVYDKSRLYSKQTGETLSEVAKAKQQINNVVNIFNIPEFTSLFDNKLNQAVVFGDMQPETELLLPGEVINNPERQKLVIKDFYGSGGYQVKITDEEKITIKRKSLKQQFIDGAKDGKLQDTRIVFLGEEPQYALTRIAAEGSLFTNFHQGAQVVFLELSTIQSQLAACKLVHEKLSMYKKKIYSVDFLTDHSTNRHFLMEINTMPGLDVFNGDSIDILKEYLSNLTDYLLA